MQDLTKQIIQQLLKPRETNSNKGTYGHALIIAGNEYKMGAAVIAAKACLRSGVGLLTMNVPKEERIILQTAIPEAMLSPRENKDYDINNFSAIAIGPGIGIEEDAVKLCTIVLTDCNKPLILDADALNIIAKDKKLLNQLKPQTIITPHPKEFDRLFGEHTTAEERKQTAIKKAIEHNIVIVLKDYQTLITYNNESFLNTNGNAGLAKGGSGDALTGIITAFLGQGYEPFIAAQIGVYLHGLASEITMEKQSMESMLITDVIENLGKAFKESLPNKNNMIGFRSNK